MRVRLPVLVFGLATACADAKYCESRADMVLAQQSVDCYRAKTGHPPADLNVAVADADCGLRRVPADALGRPLQVRVRDGAGAVVTADGRTVPHWALCFVGRTALLGWAGMLSGVAVFALGLVAHRRRLLLLGVVLCVAGGLVFMFGPIG